MEKHEDVQGEGGGEHVSPATLLSLLNYMKSSYSSNTIV